MLPQLPRFQQVTRRAFLQRSLLVGGALAAGASALAACSSDDDAALAGDDATVTSASSPTAADPGTSSVAGSESTAVSSGDVVPASAQLQVRFTYTASASDRRVRNPYIAVWIETPAGDLVQTISLWYEAREAKYLRELSGWYDAERDYLDAGGPDNVDEISGATRAAGSYDVAWDGTDATGARVPQGDYVLFVESAREKGPHQLTTTPLTLGTAAFDLTLEDNGELTAVSASYTV